MRNWIGAALLLISAAAANAQTPYAGIQTRSIKALSEQQVADLSAGRGRDGGSGAKRWPPGSLTAFSLSTARYSAKRFTLA